MLRPTGTHRDHRVAAPCELAGRGRAGFWMERMTSVSCAPACRPKLTPVRNAGSDHWPMPVCLAEMDPRWPPSPTTEVGYGQGKGSDATDHGDHAVRPSRLRSSTAAMRMRLFVGPVEGKGPEVSDGTAISRRVMTTELKISEEPLAERVLRQVRAGTLDEARLLPSAEKRERDVGKKLDRLAARLGWYIFIAGQAHAVATGRAFVKRDAEITAVEQVGRWRSEVSRFAPDRLEEFDELIADALNNPAPMQRSDR